VTEQATIQQKKREAGSEIASRLTKEEREKLNSKVSFNAAMAIVWGALEAFLYVRKGGIIGPKGLEVCFYSLINTTAMTLSALSAWRASKELKQDNDRCNMEYQAELNARYQQPRHPAVEQPSVKGANQLNA
jgi:hypothetical protein